MPMQGGGRRPHHKDGRSASHAARTERANTCITCRSLATYTSELAEVLSRFVYLVSTVALSRRGEAEREDFSTDIKVLGLSPFLHRRSYQPVGHMFRLTNLRRAAFLSPAFLRACSKQSFPPHEEALRPSALRPSEAPYANQTALL